MVLRELRVIGLCFPLPPLQCTLFRTLQQLLRSQRHTDSTERAWNHHYDDAQGITARFNLNLIHRINRELQGTIPAGAFRHVALWNDYEARIEMHLEAARDIEFTVAGQAFSIAEGETIHTENSLNYGPRETRTLLRAGGWTPIAEWTDPEGLFALVLASNSSTALPPWPLQASSVGSGGRLRAAAAREVIGLATPTAEAVPKQPGVVG